MNHTTNSSSHSQPLDQLIENPITEAIEVEIADSYAPILVDLCHLFGGEYKFRASVECYGVADIDLIDKNGLLYLSANPEALDGASTRVAVSATDATGKAKTWIFKVQAVEIGKAASQVA